MPVPYGLEGRATLRPGRPRYLFRVDSQGKNFLVGRTTKNIFEDYRPVTKLNLVVNWFEELNRLCPAGKYDRHPCLS